MLGRTIIEGGGGAQIRFGRPRLGYDFIQDPNCHRSQQLDLGNVDAEGAFELRAESSGCVMIRVSYNGPKTEAARRTSQEIKTIGCDQGVV